MLNTHLLKKCLLASFYITLLFTHFTSELTAKDYYIDKNKGNDSNSGSFSSPWKTIEKANNSLMPGDKVFLRGGEFSGQQIAPKNSGTSGQPISYIAFENEKPILTNVSIGILLNNKKYIIVEGIYIDGKKLYETSGVQQWAQLHNSHHCIIKSCNFKYAKGWSGVSLDDGSSFNKILNNRIDYCGTWNDGKGEDKGDAISMKCANNNLIEGNHLTHGGHNLLSVFGSFNVIKNNIFDNSWGKDGNGNPIGNRCLAITNEDGKSCSNTIGGYNIFEYNVVRNSYRASDNNYPHAMKAQGENQIVRFNVIYNSVHSGISGTASNAVKYALYQRIYNNTICNSGGPSWLLEQSRGLESKNNIFKNNISVEVGSKPKSSKFSGHVFLNVAEANNGYFNENKIIGNCFYSPKTTGDGIYIKNIGLQGALEVENKYKEFVHSNRNQDPNFLSSNPEADGNFNLNPKSSLIDAGEPLAFVNQQKGSGKQIKISDARYFYDGFGITTGDRIQIGKSVTTISKIDYKNNIIYVNETVAWETNDPVNLTYHGNGPDIGAKEFESSPASGNPTAILKTVDEIDFGVISIDSTITKAVTLENQGNKDIEISQIEFPKNFSGNIDNKVIPAGKSKTLTLTFSPDSVGKVDGILKIISNAENDILTIILKGEGKSAFIENKPPTIKLSTSVGINPVNIGEIVTVLASATDPDGEVESVEFFINEIKVGIAIAEPFSIEWEPLKSGQHNIKAKAIDNHNNSTFSEPIIINVLKSDFDSDNDGIEDSKDNCPNKANPNQEISQWYVDKDNDGFGGSESVIACEQPIGYVNNSDDCDDENHQIHPNTKWYLDADKDGLGSDEYIESCVHPEGYVLNSDDDNDDSKFGFIREFVLYDAVEDRSIKKINDYEKINIDSFLNKSFNIQVNTEEAPGSIVFYLNGKAVRTESQAPFTLFGDKNGDYYPWNPELQKYELTVKIYSEKKGTGNLIESKSITFEFVDQPEVEKVSFNGFSLIDAAEEKGLGTVINSDKINLSYLNTNELNIEANVAGEPGSVEFYLDGNLVRTENNAPFTMFGDKNGDYFSWNPDLGEHKIGVKVFASKDGGGDLLDSDEITVFIIKSLIDGFELVDAENDKMLGLIRNNQIINLATLKSKQITFEAKTRSKFGSVLFYLNGELYSSENSAPYAFAGDDNGDFFPANLPTGNYQLKAKAFSERKGKGEKLATYTLNFSIEDNFTLVSPTYGESFETGEVIALTANVPNSSNGRTGNVKVEFFANDYKIGEALEYPFQLNWSTFTKGAYKLTAKMVTLSPDAAELGVTPEVHVGVIKITNLLPNVSLINQPGLEYKLGSNVELEVAAEDKDGNIEKIKLFNGSDFLVELPKGMYQYVWKYPEPGIYSISALAYDNDGDSSFSESVNLVVLNSDGSYPKEQPKEFYPIAFDPELESETLEEATLEVNFGPNPVDSKLNLSINHPYKGKINIRIMDAFGKTVENNLFQKNQKELIVEQNFDSYASGMYLVHIFWEGKIKTLKINKR
ncbi:Ig-like domain-containing protein [Flexithrix dorotheae]|uniref:Ig-like domain-containing protein n=1 Tax=Flexithrix dorotheae TaxID=70993 RepID=UPI00036E0BD6|nr:Ig-like domain-containing protein [Flexithrix dorotheae]